MVYYIASVLAAVGTFSNNNNNNIMCISQNANEAPLALFDFFFLLLFCCRRLLHAEYTSHTHFFVTYFVCGCHTHSRFCVDTQYTHIAAYSTLQLHSSTRMEYCRSVYFMIENTCKRKHWFVWRQTEWALNTGAFIHTSRIQCIHIHI